MSFESCAKEVRGITFQKSQHFVRKRVEVSFYKNSLEPRAKEERNHSQSRAEEKGNTTSNLARKSEEVTRSSKTLNSYGRGAEHQVIGNHNPHTEEKGSITLKSCTQEKRSHKIIKNLKPHAEES